MADARSTLDTPAVLGRLWEHATRVQVEVLAEADAEACRILDDARQAADGHRRSVERDTDQRRRRVLVEAETQAAHVRAHALDQAAEVRARAAAEAAALVARAQAAAERVLLEARAERLVVVTSAEVKARTVLSNAESDAAHIRSVAAADADILLATATRATVHEPVLDLTEASVIDLVAAGARRSGDTSPRSAPVAAGRAVEGEVIDLDGAPPRVDPAALRDLDDLVPDRRGRRRLLQRVAQLVPFAMVAAAGTLGASLLLLA